MALRAIETLLNTANGKGVVERARLLARLEQRLLPCLGPALAGHCRLANFREGTLVVQVPSGVWASRLRYELPRLVTCLREAGVRAERVEVVVAPPQGAPEQTRRATSISPESRSLLLQAAKTVSYPALGAALRRLASSGSGGGSAKR